MLRAKRFPPKRSGKTRILPRRGLHAVPSTFKFLPSISTYYSILTPMTHYSQLKSFVIVTLTVSLSLLFCAACEPADDDQRQHLVIVFDGLRADYITHDIMPNLYRLGQEGVVADNHHVVYPPVTRVNSPSLATGSYPGTHGLMHNQIYLPEISDEPIHTGNDVESLMAVDPLLTATSLGQWMEMEDLTLFAGSSGSYGSSFLLNPAVSGAGVWNSRGFFVPDENRNMALEAFGELPEISTPNYEQNRWVINTWLHFAVDEFTADASILWITDPDRTAHTYGIGAPETLTALRHVDEELGRLLDELDERGLLEQTNIFITTDHGFSTHKGGFNVSDILQEQDLLEGARVIGNTQIYLEEPDEERIRQIVQVLQQHPAVGAIFTPPGEQDETDGRVEGTLSMELIYYNHERAADIFVTAAWSDETNEFGYAGTSTQGGTAGHGTASPYELQTAMIISGPDFKNGVVSPVPTGNVDLAPTILYLLGLSLPESMDGRIMHELLVDGPDPESISVQIDRYETGPVEWDPDYKMTLEKARTGESAYLRQARIVRNNE